MRWRVRSLPKRVESASSGGGENSRLISGGGGQRLAGVGANPVDHGAQAVGALRRQMLAKSELIEYSKRIGGKNFLRRAARKQRQQDRDQSSYNMGVTVAEIGKYRFVAAVTADVFCEPNLAGAALDLVGCGMCRFRHRLPRPADFDDIPVTILPIVQHCKLIPD